MRSIVFYVFKSTLKISIFENMTYASIYKKQYIIFAEEWNLKDTISKRQVCSLKKKIYTWFLSLLCPDEWGTSNLVGYICLF